jgi:Na+-transporting methylmalonyl-CoA/oxaloacetate decarboxylase gamma subunit
MISTIGKVSFDFSQASGSGLTIAIVGWLIVFAALILLVIVFTQVPKIIYYNTRKKLKQKSKNTVSDDEFHISGDVSAAISMALYMFFNEMHDEESNVITIKRVRKVYSPWSSKIYGLRVWPRK